MLPQEIKATFVELGLDPDQLKAALIAEEEVAIELPQLVRADKVITEEQKNTFGSNRFEEGKKAMGEILAKTYNDRFDLGLEEGDRKNIDKVFDVFGQKKLKDANIQPDKKVESLMSDLEALKKTNLDLTEAVKQKDSEYSLKMFKLQSDSEVLNALPQGMAMPKEDVKALFDSAYSVGKDDQGRTVVMKGNEVLKDPATHDPLPLNKVIASFVDERSYLKTPGMGGGDKGGGSSTGFGKMSEFVAYCKANSLNPSAAEAQKLLLEKKSESFDYGA